MPVSGADLAVFRLKGILFEAEGVLFEASRLANT
jgi:hypothetical protein